MSEKSTPDTRMIFPDELQPGSVIIESCSGNEHCGSRTTHTRGKLHELTVLRKRGDEARTTAIVLDEDGQQQPWARNNVESIRVVVPQYVKETTT